MLTGNSYRGLASKKAPEGGFNSTEVRAIFSTTIARTAAPTSFPTASSTSSTSSSTSTSISSSQPSSTGGPKSFHTNAGAIAGGVVGGLAAVAAIAGYFFLRRHNRRKKEREAGSEPLQHYDDGGVKELETTPSPNVVPPVEAYSDDPRNNGWHELSGARARAELPGA